MERTELLTSIFASVAGAVLFVPIAWRALVFPQDREWYYVLLIPLALLLALPPLTAFARSNGHRVLSIVQAVIYTSALVTGAAGLSYVLYLGLTNLNSEEPGLVLIFTAAASIVAAGYTSVILLIDQEKVDGKLTRAAKWVFAVGALPFAALLVLLVVELVLTAA